MIEINLLPGSGRKTKGKGAGITFAGAMSGAASQVKAPFLIGAVASFALAALIIGGLFLRQGAVARSLTVKEQRAVQDSTRFAAVLKDRKKAEAQRDSVLRQLAIIKSIDNDRFVWPHIMDEVSRALPPYTWITTMQQTSVPPTAASVDAEVTKGDKSAPPPPPPMKFRLLGNTVDIQALTRFMKLLEQSPFIQNIQLAKSDLIVEGGKEVTAFQLEAEYQTPDPSVVRTVPVALSVR